MCLLHPSIATASCGFGILGRLLAPEVISKVNKLMPTLPLNLNNILASSNTSSHPANQLHISMVLFFSSL